MLRFFLDYREVGLYSLGYNFGMVMLVFLGAVNASWSPTFMRIAENEENAPQILSRMANHVWRIFCLGAAVYLLWINELITIATPAEYHSATNLSKLIVISYLIYGSYLLYANGLFVAKKTRLVPVATITAAVVNILMNGLLIPAHGAYGAVVATAVSFATMTVLIYIMARKYYPLSVGPGSLAVTALVPLAYFIFSVILDARFDLISRSAGKVVLTIPLILYAYAKIRRKSPDS
jgi:O-antigen/teichoic acid export membrane protein